mmetsp:Transcript_5868/g.36385  ORF Transcript_5868/g.36385 Transcript_5868/m.36385 type:complete len:153 (-) Transcript_5868:2731-3189(-)
MDHMHAKCTSAVDKRQTPARPTECYTSIAKAMTSRLMLQLLLSVGHGICPNLRMPLGALLEKHSGCKRRCVLPLEQVLIQSWSLQFGPGKRWREVCPRTAPSQRRVRAQDTRATLLFVGYIRGEEGAQLCSLVWYAHGSRNDLVSSNGPAYT